MADRLPDDPRWPRAGDWPTPAEALDARDARATRGGDGRLDVTLLGVPTWRTSLSPTGAHATPPAIRRALRRYSPALMPDRSGRADASSEASSIVDLAEVLGFADAGDVDEPDGEAGEARTRAAASDALARSRTLVALGGDNSATVPVALAAFGDDRARAGLVTLDAHYDLRDGRSNGSPVRRLVEAGLDPSRIVQVGIADFANSAEYARRARDLGITVVHRDELHRRPIDDVMAEAFAVAGAAGGPVHVDLDVDVCDRSVVPACPASVPGGLAAWELRAAARAAGAHPAVRSVDLVEIDATADAPDERTVRLAALCVLEFAAGVARRSGSVVG
ncbi:arginase family protein [Agromyces sp. MMS24-K17]|uniref:arginase family protein n=1 Tax=Agromyces sp. MMS24-K17 TaxID=3372850 RepID=UPI003754AAB9